MSLAHARAGDAQFAEVFQEECRVSIGASEQRMVGVVNCLADD
jgi:hypothetical protein